ncbi:Calmodulin [Balamuthia mandrillaris]
MDGRLAEAFDLFDTEGDGKINSSDIGTVLRALGQDPSQAELNDILQSVEGGAGPRRVDMNEFRQYVGRVPAKTLEDVRESFKVFDPNLEGKLKYSDLRYVMTNLGEAMTEQEFEQMTRNVAVDDQGKLEYGTLANEMIRTSF